MSPVVYIYLFAGKRQLETAAHKWSLSCREIPRTKLDSILHALSGRVFFQESLIISRDANS